MTDLEIASRSRKKHIQTIIENLNLNLDHIDLYGRYKAKIPLSYINKNKVKSNNLILVTATSPTPAGEGKTTMSIGLTEALNQLGKQTIVVLREPSLGPVFGIKGGATGGGYSQVLPLEDINLHFTGDFGTIEKAHNLLSAVIDNNIQSKTNNLGIDPRTVCWKRVVDMNDRALRHVVIGLGGTANGVPRESGFDITAASEIMAILCLSDDLNDLKERLGKIFIGFTYSKKPIFASDLKVNGAMAALLKEAIKPNLVQTIEGNPAIVHCGPFANIAQGTNSVVATKMGMSLSDYTVTEAGFGADLGAEKFMNIKCQSAGIAPKAIVLNTTIRALKYHGGIDLKSLKQPNAVAVKQGLPNLEKHLENIRHFGINPVIAINKFSSDTEEEIDVIKQFAVENNARVSLAEVWEKGGEGGLDLARQVLASIEEDNSKFKPLYDWKTGVEEKIATIAKNIYGAADVEYSALARRNLKTISELGLNDLPVCIAKTQKSLSDNPKLLGKPSGFTVNIREIEIASGAGFLIPIAGNIMRMPGLPSVPASENITIDNEGNISGLF